VGCVLENVCGREGRFVGSGSEEGVEVVGETLGREGMVVVVVEVIERVRVF
jgi:hypothetical protein